MTPVLLQFVKDIAPRVVVIGGMARVFHGVQEVTKDLDLLWDMDSEPAREVIKVAVRRAIANGAGFTSVAPGSWTLRDPIEEPDLALALDTAMVEIIPFCRSGSYLSLRRSAVVGDFCGVALQFASLDVLQKELQVEYI